MPKDVQRLPAKKVPTKKAAPAKKVPAKKVPAKKAVPARLALPAATPQAVLGLPPTYTQAELQRAWRRFAATHHPDRGGDQATFVRGQRAYEQLGGGSAT
ncbi:hypothetical protein acdb102_06820 [Acidothermaceae bacterium B102]|nr:hypothetical protein acdb102_06820 [Acidothermaceae bacterium B102]